MTNRQKVACLLLLTLLTPSLGMTGTTPDKPAPVGLNEAKPPARPEGPPPPMSPVHHILDFLGITGDQKVKAIKSALQAGPDVATGLGELKASTLELAALLSEATVDQKAVEKPFSQMEAATTTIADAVWNVVCQIRVLLTPDQKARLLQGLPDKLAGRGPPHGGFAPHLAGPHLAGPLPKAGGFFGMFERLPVKTEQKAQLAKLILASEAQMIRIQAGMVANAIQLAAALIEDKLDQEALKSKARDLAKGHVSQIKIKVQFLIDLKKLVNANEFEGIILKHGHQGILGFLDGRPPMGDGHPADKDMRPGPNDRNRGPGREFGPPPPPRRDMERPDFSRQDCRPPADRDMRPGPGDQNRGPGREFGPPPRPGDSSTPADKGPESSPTPRPSTEPSDPPKQ